MINSKNEMIRDSIVIGICDASLSEKLQMDWELTLEKVKTIICQRGAVHDQQCVFKGNTVDLSPVDAVSGTSSHRYEKTKKGQKLNGPKKYMHCGKNPTPS